MKKIYFWSKKIHRWMMWLTILFGFIMMVTGLLMETSLEGERLWLLKLFNMRLVRQLHVACGKYLVVTLTAMIVTGFILWAYPLWIQRQAKKNLPKTPAQ